MYQQQVNHPANLGAEPLATEVYEAMYEVFEQISTFWGNLPAPQQYKSRLFVFMDNRIRLHPEYRSIYTQAKHTLDALIAEVGKAQAYKTLFTDPPPTRARRNHHWPWPGKRSPTSSSPSRSRKGLQGLHRCSELPQLHRRRIHPR